MEFACRFTLSKYILPPKNPKYTNWFTERIKDNHIASRVQDLYQDREQTEHQQDVLSSADARMCQPEFGNKDNPIIVDDWNSPLREVYSRALTLYAERIAYIQSTGNSRISSGPYGTSSV